MNVFAKARLVVAFPWPCSRAARLGTSPTRQLGLRPDGRYPVSHSQHARHAPLT